MKDELLFPANSTKAALLLAGALVLVSLSVLVVPKRPILGWLSGGFFMLCAFGALFALFTNKVYVKLTPCGLEVSAFLQKRKYRWSELEYFSIQRFRGIKQIPLVTRTKKGQGLWGGMNLGNHYSASLEELCNALNNWRERYGREAG